MRKALGFSLIELVIAISLASFVLVGVFLVAARVVRSQLDGIRSGTVTGWSLVSSQAMAKEIEDASVLAYPQNNTPAAGSSSDRIIICNNWSRVLGGKYDTTTNTSVIEYCADADPLNPGYFYLRRYVGLGVACPSNAQAAAYVTCTAAAPAPAWGAWTETGVIGFRLAKLLVPARPQVFTRDNSIGGVRISYAIGAQTAPTTQPIPKFTPYDFGVTMLKQYSSTSD